MGSPNRRCGPEGRCFAGGPVHKHTHDAIIKIGGKSDSNPGAQSNWPQPSLRKLLGIRTHSLLPLANTFLPDLSVTSMLIRGESSEQTRTMRAPSNQGRGQGRMQQLSRLQYYQGETLR